jgi:alkanesulfonate monooxygenase SsuD/methylene tetrahydromethanopterin reductase-like flavin-dependent oxidoreductase (luciferase family)
MTTKRKRTPDTTAAQRKAAERARKAAEGLAEVRGIWARPEDHAAIKSEAAKITAKPLQPLAG